jgi:hypothetical protein
MPLAVTSLKNSRRDGRIIDTFRSASDCKRDGAASAQRTDSG